MKYNQVTEYYSSVLFENCLVNIDQTHFDLFNCRYIGEYFGEISLNIVRSHMRTHRKIDVTGPYELHEILTELSITMICSFSFEF